MPLPTARGSSSSSSLSSSTKPILLAIRTSHGRKKLEVNPTTSGRALKSDIKKVLGIDEDFIVRRDNNGKPGDEIRFSPACTAKDLGLKSGDTLHILPREGTRFTDGNGDDVPMALNRMSFETRSSSTSSTSTAASGSLIPSIPVKVREDPVDVELSKLDGRISVPRSANCRHAANAACIHCMAKEPYDSKYLEEQGIKFMSFHAYLKKLLDEKGKFATLDDITLKIKPGCTNHAPWPESLCSQCRPPALTLNRQTYRHVDNIMFENAEIIDKFLAFWRQTGIQRVGYLYGRYEKFTDVPLGIRAIVSAIYEPPQESSRDHIKLLPDEKKDKVDEVALALGLVKVGWIFTDLVRESNGNVRHFRNIDTHFLSASECIMAGHLQNEHPNVTSKSPSGKHGSKFVTVLITGDKEKQVHTEGYQVSNQCMALVRDGLLVPTKDAPELGYIIESSGEQYVPDVIYKKKDDYGNEVTNLGRPLPVEYLLIDVPVATPLSPQFTFHVGPHSFPIENRPMEGHLQDFEALASFRSHFDHDNIGDFFRDFHLLIYLATQTVFPLELAPLLDALRTNALEKVYHWLEASNWSDLEAVILHHRDSF